MNQWMISNGKEKFANEILNQSNLEYKVSKDFYTQKKSMNQLFQILQSLMKLLQFAGG